MNVRLHGLWREEQAACDGEPTDRNGRGRQADDSRSPQPATRQEEDEREKALAGAVASAHAAGEVRVRAPMPGLVLDVPLEVGASVARGQTVVVLEAMKMENDLASSKAGMIKEIKVSKGQTVNQGDVLVVISGE